ncbi:hypothetical protein NC651_035045 [Populus alba x Populus x berolinensis]|nr:hypothetical protein NC651_035045 [Populus alba x Populus x berolinensis]
MTTQTSQTPNEARTVATKVAKRKRKLNRLLLSSLLFSSLRNVVKDTPRPGPSSSGDNMKVTVVDWKAQELVSPNAPIDEDRSGEVKMEASLTPDDVIRAGGFGARDDKSSFLPVASDSTGFEATILDARNYEEPQGEIQRPGLGWTERKQLFCQSL